MDHVTLLRPDARAPSDARGITSALSPYPLEQIRGRVRLLALFLVVAFAFDPTIALVGQVVGAFIHRPPSREFLANLPFQWVDFVAAVFSAALWWVAGRRRVLPSRLLGLGLAYEIVVCFAIAISSFWPYYVYPVIVPTLPRVAAVV